MGINWIQAVVFFLLGAFLGQRVLGAVGVGKK